MTTARRVLFYSSISYANDRPSGAAISNLAQMETLAARGHQCVLVCRLTADRARRDDTLARLTRQGVTVTSEDHPLFFLDRFAHGDVQVVAFTVKQFSEWPLHRRLRFPWYWNRRRSPFPRVLARRRRSLVDMLGTARRSPGSLGERLLTLGPWVASFVIEPVMQEGMASLEAVVTELAPDAMYIDGCLEFMQLVDVLKERGSLSAGCEVYAVFTAGFAMSFGPHARFQSDQAFLPASHVVSLYRSMSGFVTPSHFLGEYLEDASGLEVRYTVVHPRIASLAPRQERSREPDRGFVTLINASWIKGLSVFLELARRLPDVPFALVTTWGDLGRPEQRRLEALANVQVLKPVSPVDPIYDLTRVLLVPSLWEDPFPRVVNEAMLRGIPVLASDRGGIPEAKHDVPYVLPVTPYLSAADYHRPPPPQDVDPWVDALGRLVGDPDHYREVSEASRQASREFVRAQEARSIADAWHATR